MKRLIVLTATNGNNKKLAEVILSEAKEKGFDGECISLVDLNLPLYSTEAEEKGIPEKAKELADKLMNSNSIALVAPEYNGSIPPCVNNAIAWISRSGEDWRSSFNGKSALIATHSGGGGTHALMSMRQQLSYLGVNVLGRQLLTSYSKELNVESLRDCLNQL